MSDIDELVNMMERGGYIDPMDEITGQMSRVSMIDSREEYQRLLKNMHTKLAILYFVELGNYK